MRVAATYNIKGGVGKTATAVNLAYLAAAEGMRTLVWDLDPQGAATFYFRIKPKVRGGGKKLVKGDSDLMSVAKGTDFDNLDIVPSDFSLRHLDIHLEQKKNPTKRLKKLLEPLEKEYDLVILDCPPSISLVSESVFFAADALIIPVIPTPLSLRTLEQLERFRRDNSLEKLKFLVFLSMVDRRKKLHRELAEELYASRRGVLKASIPYASDVERMGTQKCPLGVFARKSAAWRGYVALWLEVRGLLFPSQH